MDSFRLDGQSSLEASPPDHDPRSACSPVGVLRSPVSWKQSLMGEYDNFHIYHRMARFGLGVEELPLNLGNLLFIGTRSICIERLLVQ